MLAVILAGGLGTRLLPLTEDIPKPMIEINKKPFLEYEIELLKKNGIRDFVFCVGYKSEVIQNYFGEGKDFGVKISYSFEEKELLGPAGALRKAGPLLKENFMVTYADGYLPLDYRSAWNHFLLSGKLGMMVVYENHNKFGKSDIEVEKGLVTRYSKKDKSPRMVWINFGVSFLKKKALSFIPKERPCGEEEFYNELISRRELLGYETRERFYEIGTPSSLKEFSLYISSRKI